MPNIIWNSNKQKKIEFEKAAAYFLANKDQSKYRRKDSELQHSFMKFGDTILAMNTEGNHLAKGSYRVLSAKLSEDQNGKLYVIKREKFPQKNEYSTGTDLGIITNHTVRHLEEKYTDKYYLCYQYLGTSLDHLFDNSPKDNQYISAQNRFNYAIKICRLLDKLHNGTLSKSGTAYAHLDIKPGNITKDHQGQFHFIDLAACEKLDGKASNKHDNDHGTRAYLPKEHQGISYQNLDIFALLKTCYLEGAPSLFTKEMLDTNKSLEKLCQSNIQDKITPIQLMIRFILIKHELPLEENIGLINPNFARILVDNNLYNKTILQQALHSSNLQAAVIAVNNPKISFAENWIQLQENIYLQKAAIALYNADIDFSKDGNWLKLKENTNLQKALAIAYDYLNYNNFISKSKQELYAEKQTLQLIQNLIAKKNNSLDMIRTEMQQWVSGYAPPAIQSSIDTPSPANIDHHPRLFGEPTILFFNMSNTKCKEVRQAILDSHFN